MRACRRTREQVNLSSFQDFQKNHALLSHMNRLLSQCEPIKGSLALTALVLAGHSFPEAQTVAPLFPPLIYVRQSGTSMDTIPRRGHAFR